MTDFRGAAYAKYVTANNARVAVREGRALEHYLRWCEIKFRPFLEALPRAAHVLDLGCGSGDVMRLLNRRGCRAEGIDISNEQVRLAVQAGLDARQVDAFDFLATRADAYDGIVALDFIEHFAKDELMRLFGSIADALKPHGLLLIQTPNGEGLFANQIIYGDLTHMTILNPRSLRQALALAGFEKISVYEAGPAPIGVTGRIRSVTWPAVRTAARLARSAESPRSAPVLTENMIAIAQLAVAGGVRTSS
jgi:2-polyprenyl-3-methyl-5-hydroxy-6-metoxy-1,4-benzoquinol methylase